MPEDFDSTQDASYDKFRHVSHEDTIRLWRTVVEEELCKIVEAEVASWTLEKTIEQMHEDIHWVIDDQEGKRHYSATSSLKYLLQLCAMGLVDIAPQVSASNHVSAIETLMIEKNKVYGSSWSIMRPAGIADVIHTKVHRIESVMQDVENPFESLEDSLKDIFNYTVFCLIRMGLEDGSFLLSVEESGDG